MIESLVGPRDTTRYASREAVLADFATRPESPDFPFAPQPAKPFAAFGRSAVLIEHDGGEAFLADRNTVALYAAGAAYRAPVSPTGDHSSWFALRRTHPVFAESGSRQVVGIRLCPLPAYMELLRIRARARAGLAGDDVALALGGILDQVAVGRGAIASAGASFTAALVEAARRRLARSYRSPEPLRELFFALGEPHYAICQAFRRHLGWTPHQYREQLRVRRALDEIPTALGSLTDLALSLGYSSHSHFTERFRRSTGVAPLEWARRVNPVA